MIKIFAKILLLVLPSAIAVIFTIDHYSHGYIDVHYGKIRGEGKSLIIGTSRASQGIIPEICAKNIKYEEPLLNFAFTSFNSPYCEAYFNAIQKKMNSTVKNGVFILEIDPFGLTDNTSEKASSKLLSQQFIMHGDPNYEYIYRNVNPFYNLLVKNNNENPFCIAHKNGWVQVKIEQDSLTAIRRAQEKLAANLKEISYSKLSDNKLHWLEKTIALLKTHGKVILIRIPAWQPIIDAEKNAFPTLNDKINSICSSNNVPYFDYTNLNNMYHYIDGNHLTNESARQFSKELNKLILAL